MTDSDKSADALARNLAVQLAADAYSDAQRSGMILILTLFELELDTKQKNVIAIFDSGLTER